MSKLQINYSFCCLNYSVYTEATSLTSVHYNQLLFVFSYFTLGSLCRFFKRSKRAHNYALNLPELFSIPCTFTLFNYLDFLDGVSPCSFGYPGTHSLGCSGLELIKSYVTPSSQIEFLNKDDKEMEGRSIGR